MPIAKALKIDRAIRRNVYAYQVFLVRTLVVSASCCPWSLISTPFASASTARLFLDIGANDGISARSFRLFNKTTPIFSIEPNPCHEAALNDAAPLLSISSTTGLLPQASDAAS